jgi:hypothetical protein
MNVNATFSIMTYTVSCVKFDALKAVSIENNQNHHSYY